MNWNVATDIYRQIRPECIHDSILRELQSDLLEKAVRYAQIRTNWELSDLNKRHQMDEYRKRTHDALIAACDILKREMAHQGLDVSWRATLGQQREEIGDFACFIHCFLGLTAR